MERLQAQSAAAAAEVARLQGLLAGAQSAAQAEAANQRIAGLEGKVHAPRCTASHARGARQDAVQLQSLGCLCRTAWLR